MGLYQQTKRENFNNEFLNRIEALDKEYNSLNILETRTQLCNDDYTKEYLSKRYDPFLNGSYRRTIYKTLAPSILKNTLIEDSIKKFGINRIHGILLPDTDYDQKTNEFEKKPLSREIVDFFTFISQFVRESGSTNFNGEGPFLFSEGRINFKKGAKYFQYLLSQIATDANRKAIRIKEISKKVPRRSYK